MATQDDSGYIALTTYRRDGRAVTTPVWAVSLDGKIYVFTASSTGKAKRVRATGRVRFARAAGMGAASSGRGGRGRGVLCMTRRSRTGAAVAGDARLPAARPLSRPGGAGADPDVQGLTSLHGISVFLAALETFVLLTRDGTNVDPGGREEQSREGRAEGQFEQRISGSTDVRAGGGSATDTREQEPDHPRKRGPKRGPQSAIKNGPNGSHGIPRGSWDPT
jgi:PPOX class probable F420-dependent enzyme